jgi:hypothetical protein
MKGAIYLVASVDCGGVDLGTEAERGEETDKDGHSRPWVICSVECSTNEFAGTELGSRRPEVCCLAESKTIRGRYTFVEGKGIQYCGTLTVLVARKD